MHKTFAKLLSRVRAQHYLHIHTTRTGQSGKTNRKRVDTIVMVHATKKHVLSFQYLTILDRWPSATRKFGAKICHMDLPSICWGLPLI
jgi:hypothetical protein